MRILISGSGGLLGRALVPALIKDRGQAVRLVRSIPGQEDIFWDPVNRTMDISKLDGFDAVIHLAGESIASGRWTQEKKRKILESRALGTRFLCESLTQLKSPPKTLLCASAIGFYGDRRDEVLDETSFQGDIFLSQVCKEWEEAAKTALRKGIRVVNMRFGVILSSGGGALAKMLFPFRMGLGGKIGSGKQYMSWIDLDDAIQAVFHCLKSENLRGPVNFVSPNPVTNSEFAITLARVLGRPAFFPLPAFAARLIFGEMADDLLLSGVNVKPIQLEKTHFQFCYPELEGSLRHQIQNSSETNQ